MKEEFRNLYREMHRFFSSFYADIENIKGATVNVVEMNEQADLSYVLREVGKLLDDLKKEVEKASKQATALACADWMKQVRDGEFSSEKIKTEYVTATPDIKVGCSLPKLSTDPDNYYELMDFLGIPREVSEKDFIRIHWPNFVEFISKLQQEGRPIPPGIDKEKTFNFYKLEMRRRKGILENDGATPF